MIGKMRKYIFTGVIVLLAALAQAHEFWMQPQKFFFNPGEVAAVEFMVGENFMGERWDLRKHRIERLEHRAGRKVTTLKTDTLNDASKKLYVPLSTPGSHLLVMQSNSAYIELDAKAFEAYLKEDGLDDIIQLRQEKGLSDQPSREYYARCAKLLLQSGKQTDDTHGELAGLPLELVPLKNPYAVKIGEELSWKLLYEGKPVPFALVKIWSRKDGRTLLQNLHTGKDGIVTMRLSNTGAWMVSSVKMIPSKQPGADWQSYWASYVFGAE
jgi:uncharacterized GH25 family protein